MGSLLDINWLLPPDAPDAPDATPGARRTLLTQGIPFCVPPAPHVSLCCCATMNAAQGWPQRHPSFPFGASSLQSTTPIHPLWRRIRLCQTLMSGNGKSVSSLTVQLARRGAHVGAPLQWGPPKGYTPAQYAPSTEKVDFCQLK